jgi:creatinine amidohydrolase
MSDRDPIRLAESGWQDVEAYLDEAATPTALVPIGSTEQHGPHLPLGVDFYQAEDVAEAVSARTDVPVAPTIPYGDADHHLAFPGTISLSTETVVSVLTDIYESLIGHGFAAVITVNGHRIANLPAIQTAMSNVAADHPDVSFAAVDLVRVAAEAHRELRDGDPDDGMHAGEFETSFMLARYPDLVEEDAFEPESHPGFSRFQTDDLAATGDAVLSPSTPHSPADGDLGHVGDPTLATREKGDALRERMIKNAVTFIEELREERTGDGPA